MLALQESLLPVSLVSTPAASSEEELRFRPGVLVEISGPDARRQAAGLLASYPACPAAWIEQSLEPFPAELQRFRLNWDRILFVDGKKDSLWALSSFLRSELFPILVYYAPYGKEKDLRRLRRLAKSSGSMVLLLREEPFPAWQIHSQYVTHKGKLELLRGSRS